MPDAPSPASVREEHYAQAKGDPLASLLLDALGQQDARTYNGDSGDSGQEALDLAAAVRALIDEAAVRRDERHRLAQLLEDHRGVLADFLDAGPGAYRALDLVAYLPRLDHS